MHWSRARELDEEARRLKPLEPVFRPMFTPSEMMGRIAVFDSPEDPKKSLVGEVIAAVVIDPTKKGKIPNMLLTVRGRTGKVLDVDYVEQHTRVFDTWADAIAALG